MASGSAGRANTPGSKGFDFASDDILCSYEDYGNQDGSNGSTHSDPVIGNSSAKEFHKSRMARPSNFPATSYSPPEESSYNQDVISTVEKTMKKYADNLMRFLEGISSRLSQLELYCYNLDKTIGEMRSDLVRDHGDAESRLKSVEKHLQEVHRSVQILRDKQELADTQKELAKLHLAQKETSSGSNPQQNQDRATAADAQKSDTTSETHGQQLALALPHQILPQPSVPSRPVEQPQQPPVAPAPPMQSQTMAQQQAYYLPHSQISTAPSPAQPSQGQYLTSDSQYRTPQMQDFSRVTAQPQVNQSPQVQQLPPQYQPQWQPQLHQQVQQQPQPQPQPQPPATLQPQMRPSSTPVYASYMPTQPNPSPPEVVPNNSMPMQVQFSGISPPTASRPEPTGFGYVGASRPGQPQHPPQHLKPSYTAPTDGYVTGGPHPTISPGNAYVMYDEGGRGHHPSQATHFPQGPYPPSSMPPQNLQPPSGSSMVIRPPPQFVRNPPYNELIEKLVSMGYRGEHVVSVIQRLEESGQPVDFNAVLDRLNGHSSGGSSQRGGWSG